MQLASLKANGLTMTYLTAGAATAPPVLLIHGLGWDAARLWTGTAEALAAAGLRVLAPNLRGFGGTEATAQAYSTRLYAQDLAAFLDVLSIERLPVVGFSMGAAIAAALSAEEGRATALSLACGGLHSTEEGRAGVEALLARAETLGAAAFAAEQAEMIFEPDWAAAHPAVVAEFKAWRAEMDQSALYRAFRSGYGIDYRDAVRTSGLPVQVIAAESDPFCDLSDLEAIASHTPGAVFNVIRQSGHMSMIEQPEAFAQTLLGFLQPLARAE